VSHVTAPFMMSPEQAAALRALFPGRCWLPDDPGWDEARVAWNRYYDQQPAAVVAAASVGDVQSLVGFAREAGVPVAAQPGGHAPTAPQNGTILLRTGGLDEVTVDVPGRRARVGAGVKWQAVLDALDGTGLLADSGSNGDVSVVGYLLGGGMSWFSRARGLAVRHVRSFDVVDATGAARTVSADADPELFWALRGGGGDFAIVTAVEFDLFPGVIYAGALHWWGERTDEALAAYAAVTRTAPPELSLWTWYATWPDSPALPEERRGRSFITVQFTYLGEAADAEPLLAPLRAIDGPFRDTTGYLEPSALPDVSSEGDNPRPAMDWTRLVSTMDDAFLGRLVKLTGPASGSPLIMCLRHLGGEFTTDTGGAAGSISHPYLLLAFGSPMAPGVAEAVRDGWDTLDRELADYLDGSTPCNMLGYEHRPQRAFPPETLERLRVAKRRYDPLGTIRGNRPVLSD
jgi:FAD binding domain-containing protein